MPKFAVTFLLLALLALSYARLSYGEVSDYDDDYNIDPPGNYDPDYDEPRGGSNRRRGSRRYDDYDQPRGRTNGRYSRNYDYSGPSRNRQEAQQPPPIPQQPQPAQLPQPPQLAQQLLQPLQQLQQIPKMLSTLLSFNVGAGGGLGPLKGYGGLGGGLGRR